MEFERYVWVCELIRYFRTEAAEPEQATAVIAALGLTEDDVVAAQEKHGAPLISALLRGDSAQATALAKELGHAKREIAAKRPTLDTLRAARAAEVAREAEPNPESTAMVPLFLPKVVLPFAHGTRSKTPAAPAPTTDTPRPARSRGPADVETTQQLTTVKRSPPLPFGEAQHRETDPEADTVMQPSPFSKARKP